jgi:hypothetical protein
MTTTDAVQVKRALQHARFWDGRLHAAVEHLQDRRTERAIYKTAERELSSYTTPAEIHELDAMLERSVGDSIYTEMIERIRLRAA